MERKRMATLYRIFPPTIHPMVIHFTISIIYLAWLVGLIGLFYRRGDFYQKAFFSLLFFGILATVAAGIAGSISESYAHITRTVAPMLHDHARDGEITGVVMVIAFVVQFFHQRKKKRVSVLAFVFCMFATIMVSVTGNIGGSMVYDHGLGTHLSQTQNG
jgi:uncharacterized membrane protein